MKRCIRISAALPCIALLFSAAGCVPNDHGWAAPYKAAQHPSIVVSMPANAPAISQEFLENSGAPDRHLAIDVLTKRGTPVIAAAPGTVTEAFFEPLYGNRLVIDHGVDAAGSRMITVYKHLQKRTANKGDVVARGQMIGTLGATGALAGGIPHLHFEIHRVMRTNVLRAMDPQRFWAGGVGQVTCFDPAIPVDTTYFRTTYPVPCGTS